MRLPSSKILVSFSGAILLALFLVFLSQKKALRPLQSGLAQIPRPIVYVFSKTGNSIKSFFTYFSAVSKVNRTNGMLSEKVRNLEQENIELQQYRLENEKLRKELGFRENNPLKLISASVIQSDPTGFSQTFTLNVGSNKGVQQGQAVLSEGVLVGKIISVATQTSKMLLVTDPQSSIDAQIGSTGDNGIVRGSYGSGLILDMISQNTQINRDDLVVTAGLSSGIPKGILIGSIGELQSQKNDLLQKATVIPSVNLRDIYFVSIVQQ